MWGYTDDMKSLARRLLNNPGLIALTVPEEQEEIRMVDQTTQKAVKLQYLKGSAQKGLRLWNVLAPQLPGYTYGKDSGVPTFGLSGLKEKGLI